MKNIGLLYVVCGCLFCIACTPQPSNPAARKNAHVRSVEDSARPLRKQKTEERRTNKTYSASEVFDRYNSAVFMVFTTDGWQGFQGSGFFVNSDGLAISNYHVFKGTGMGLESIQLSDGNTYKIQEVVAKSEENDFIVFYVDIPGSCNYIPISNRTNKVGERVYAIGSPRGLENTFSSGEISQLRDNNIIQINAPIDHGSSGGALINEFGEVIGITSAGIDDSGANLNFAIDISVVKPYVSNR